MHGKNDDECSQSCSELGSEILLERPARADKLDVGAVLDDHLLILQLRIILLVDVGEAPFLGDDDLLAARELVSSAPEGLNDDSRIGILRADGEDYLADVHTGHSAVRLPPSTTHAGLETISTGTAQHLVDAKNMERMYANAKMERVLSGCLAYILVRTNTGGLEGLRRNLLILVRDKVGTERKVVDACALAAQVEDTDLWIGHTTIVPGFRIRLIFAVSVAACRATSHRK